MTNQCTHTSDWWKQMRPCASCGAEHNEDEAAKLTWQADRASRVTSSNAVQALAQFRLGGAA